MKFTIVTAVTPKYEKKLIRCLPTWSMKPQFRRSPIVLFTYKYKSLMGLKRRLGRGIQLIPLEDHGWGDRETVLSAFVLESYKHVQTDYFVKIDCDVTFKDDRDVFNGKDLNYDIVGHSWGYTKPAHWIKELDSWADDKELGGGGEYKDDFDESKKTFPHRRLASFMCLHKKQFVQEASEIAGGVLPVPSHDTYLWYVANRSPKYNWGSKNIKKRGVTTATRMESIKSSCNGSYIGGDAFLKVPNQIRKSRKNCYGLKSNILNKVQMEITTDCQMGCLNCDRSCGQAPSNENISLTQVEKFIAESLDNKHVWNRIDVIGGEPTLHPNLQNILDILFRYKKRYKRCVIRLSTHGVGEETMEIIESLPLWVKIRNSNKTTTKNLFSAYNKSPTDSGVVDPVFCDVPWRCGLGLTRYGYFPCGAGAALARVFGYDIGIKDLKDVTYESISEQLKILCKHCGHCYSESRELTKTTIITPSWENAYSDYTSNVKRMTLY